MSMFDSTRREIDIGQVIGHTFSILGRNFLTFFLLSIILVGIPQGVIAYLQLQAAGGDITGNELFYQFLGMAIGAVTGAVLQGALVHATVSDMNDRKATLADSLAVGLRAFLPLIGIGILMGIGVTLGTILLIVPGVILALMWAVTVPAYVAEERGVFESFERSAKLTAGNRWRILGLAVIYWLLFLLATLLLGGALGFGAVAAGFGSDTAVFTALLTPILTALFVMVRATATAVLYLDLRRAKEGVGRDVLAAIFD